MVLFLAGLTAFAFVVVALRRSQTARPLRAMLIIVAVGIVAYIAWIFISAMGK